MMRLVLLAAISTPLADGASFTATNGLEAEGRGFLRTGVETSPEQPGVRNLQGYEPTCRNGLPGVGSSDGQGDICCPADCGVCGGEGCADFGVNFRLGEEECCTSAIFSSGVYCADSMEAPCIMEKDGSTDGGDGMCRNGIVGVGSSEGLGHVCCVAECGRCGGEGCASFGSELGLTEHDCCFWSIYTDGDMCSDKLEAPCVIDRDGDSMEQDEDDDDSDSSEEDDDSDSSEEDDDDNDSSEEDDDDDSDSSEEDDDANMSYGYHESFDDDELDEYDTDEDEERFCHKGCFSEMGQDPFFFSTRSDILTPEECFNFCAAQIQGSLYFGLVEGVECACGDVASVLTSNKTEGVCDIECFGESSATCGGAESYDLYEIHELTSTCSNGVEGVESESGNVCCGLGCGTCGGDACVGQGDCCENTIQQRGNMCDDTLVAPCIIVEADFTTPAPAPRPTSQPTSSYASCPGGVRGLESEDGTVCCEYGCTECTPVGENCIGYQNCCVAVIHNTTSLCSEVGESPCVLVP